MDNRIFWAILIGSFVIAATVAVVGRHQITGGPERISDGGSYVVRDNWTGRSWYENIGR